MIWESGVDGSQFWHCEKCGRQVVFTASHEYRVIKQGDFEARHSGMKPVGEQFGLGIRAATDDFPAIREG